MKSVIKEKTGKIIFTAAAIICIIAVVAIFIFMFVKSIPAFKKIGLFDFIFGDNWSPDRLDKYGEPLSGSYGIFKMIVGTAAATVTHATATITHPSTGFTGAITNTANGVIVPAIIG